MIVINSSAHRAKSDPYLPRQIEVEYVATIAGEADRGTVALMLERAYPAYRVTVFDTSDICVFRHRMSGVPYIYAITLATVGILGRATLVYCETDENLGSGGAL